MEVVTVTEVEVVWVPVRVSEGVGLIVTLDVGLPVPEPLCDGVPETLLV